MEIPFSEDLDNLQIEGEDRVTKKVKKRDRQEQPMAYKESLMNGTVMDSSMGDVMEKVEIAVDSDDVMIDRSGIIPKVIISSNLRSRLASSLENAIVVSVLGKTIGYKGMCNRLETLWDMSDTKVLDIGRGFFLVMFSKKENYDRSLLNGPWMIMGSYLLVQNWTPSFRVQSAYIGKTTVLIRLPELPLHLYPAVVLRAISEVVGPVVKVDYHTSDFQRAKFARVAVTIDLDQPLVSKFEIDGELQKVEYENLPEVCFSCGRFGHLEIFCPYKPKPSEAESHPIPESSSVPVGESSDNYGSWMIVDTRKHYSRKTGVTPRKE